MGGTHGRQPSNAERRRAISADHIGSGRSDFHDGTDDSTLRADSRDDSGPLRVWIFRFVKRAADGFSAASDVRYGHFPRAIVERHRQPVA